MTDLPPADSREGSSAASGLESVTLFTNCPNRPEWAEPSTAAISPEGHCFHCSKVRGEWVKCEGDDCG